MNLVPDETIWAKSPFGTPIVQSYPQIFFPLVQTSFESSGQFLILPETRPYLIEAWVDYSFLYFSAPYASNMGVYVAPFLSNVEPGLNQKLSDDSLVYLNGVDATIFYQPNHTHINSVLFNAAAGDRIELRFKLDSALPAGTEIYADNFELKATPFPLSL